MKIAVAFESFLKQRLQLVKNKLISQGVKVIDAPTICSCLVSLVTWLKSAELFQLEWHGHGSPPAVIRLTRPEVGSSSIHSDASVHLWAQSEYLLWTDLWAKLSGFRSTSRSNSVNPRPVGGGGADSAPWDLSKYVLGRFPKLKKPLYNAGHELNDQGKNLT